MTDDPAEVPLEDEIDSVARQYIDIGYAPGLAYGVTHAGGLRHGGGIGTSGHSRVDVDTVFPIASLSKSFFACAALIARDEGLLSLDDPISRHVPEFRTISDDGSEPTLEMLLGMHGGLTEDNAWIDPQIDMPLSQLLAQLGRGVRLSHDPGTAYEYSNLGYAVATLAIGRAVGRPIYEYLRERVIEPLGLRSTYADGEVREGVRRADGFRRGADGRWSPYGWRAADGMIGACGLMSSVRDMATWVTWLGAAYRAPLRGEVDDVLSRRSRRDLQRVRILIPPSLAVNESGTFDAAQRGYALGLRVGIDVGGGMIVSHTGGLPGFTLAMAWRPASGYGAVILSNSNRGEAVELCSEMLSRMTARENAPADTITLWPETVELLEQVDGLVRTWDDLVAERVLAANVDIDRPLAERRAEIEKLVSEVGPLLPSRLVVAAASPADVSWLIAGERGALLCRIHVTPVDPVQVQSFVVRRIRSDQPWAAALAALSGQRTRGLVEVPMNASIHNSMPSFVQRDT
jgi:CubicO group peptidase (beta-lactamase class C family)